MEIDTHPGSPTRLAGSAHDPNGRVLLYELTEGQRNEGWRVFRLADGGYTFEVQSDDVVVLAEYYASFAEVADRVNQWQAEGMPGRAA